MAGLWRGGGCGLHVVTAMLSWNVRRELSVPYHFEPLPIPVAFALGPEPVQQAGVDHARRAPVPGTPLSLGATARPGLYYLLGDGTSASSWTSIEQFCDTWAPPLFPDRPLMQCSLVI